MNIEAPDLRSSDDLLQKAVREQRFESLSSQWKKETELLSNVTTKCTHVAYQKIIGMGQDAVPLILKDMKENGPDIECERLFDDPYVLACTRAHPLAKRKTVKWEELEDYRIITVGRLSGHSTQVDFAPYNVAMRRHGPYEVKH